ncbi:MAG TPA: hypothetical protein VGL81_02545 [Polyangiaceae bacterium]|jgi:hypothetical protein
MQARNPRRPPSHAAVLRTRALDDLILDDEASFRHVGLYADLKAILRRDGYLFRVLPASSEGRWDRALLLNLTFWASGDGGDVLVEDRLSADVVAHVAWHHLAARALPSPPSAEALFLGESIASAFDVYLVGRLLGHAPRSTFLATQVPAMAEAAGAAGLSDEGFEALLERIAGDPDRAFEELRELLYDAANALHACSSAQDGLGALASFDGHPYAALLHHYELSNWVLYARAYAPRDAGPDEAARAVDRALRAEKDALEWLARTWVTPASAK